MKKMIGIVLLSVLIFLQIMTLLGLLMMQTAWLEIKQSQYAWRKEITVNLANQAMHGLESIEAPSSCIISVTPTAILEQYPLSWWKSFLSCTGNFQAFQYYYVVEFLGSDPCAVVEVSPKKIIANYFRITLYGLSGGIKIVLQSTVIKPTEGEALKCNGITHHVDVGQQMWRELT